MKKISAFIFLVLLLGLVPSWSANTPKAGSSCSKKGATQIYQNKKFTCVSSGKKLIWDKGVVVKKTETSTSSSNTSNDINNQICLVENQILRNNVGEFWCIKDKANTLRWAQNHPSNSSSGQNTSNNNQGSNNSQQGTSNPNDAKLGKECDATQFKQEIASSYGTLFCKWDGAYTFRWNVKYVAPILSTSKSNNYKTTPIPNAECSQSGDTFDIAGGYLECRYVSGGKLIWMKINTVKNGFTNQSSPSGIDVCKLQSADVDISKLPANTRGGARDLGQVPGFPVTPRNGFVNPGVNKALIVGIDFPELRGSDAELKSINTYDKKILNEWFSYFSNGNARYEVTSIDYWLHAPKSAKNYSTRGTFDSTAENGNSGNDAVTQQIIDIITKEIDLSQFTTIFTIHPKGEITLDTDWIVRNRPFKTKEGIKNFNFFGWDRDNEIMGTEHWAYYIHEVLHDGPIVGHAPGNGWPFGIMTQQSGISYSPFSWELFQLGWLKDNQVYCVDSGSLTKSSVSLTPLEREDSQTKSVIIKLSKTKAIVVESHGIDKWSSFNTDGRSFPPGFYGVMAYLVDFQNAVAPPVQTDGRAIQDDSGNDEKYPRWAYFKKIDGGESFKGQFSFQSGSEKYNSYIATLGDTFTIEGIKIKLIGAGDYETIEITKA